MKIYLAAAWSRKDEILDIALRLEAMNHIVTSRWLTNEDYPAYAEIDEHEALRQKHAIEDVEDVLTADAIIRFSDASEMVWPLVPSKLLSGARMFEMGVMYTLQLFTSVLREHKGKLFFYDSVNATTKSISTDNKLLFVVGGKQNIFDRLPEVMNVDTVDNMLKIMKRAAQLEGILGEE